MQAASAPASAAPTWKSWSGSPCSGSLTQVDGDKEQAQKLLGISRATLYRKIKRYGIPYGRRGRSHPRRRFPRREAGGSCLKLERMGVSGQNGRCLLSVTSAQVAMAGKLLVTAGGSVFGPVQVEGSVRGASRILIVSDDPEFVNSLVQSWRRCSMSRSLR